MTPPTSSVTISESFWPVRSAIIVIVVLQMLLNERVSAGPNWLLPMLQVARTRVLTGAMIALLSVANLGSLLKAARPLATCCVR